MMEILVRWGKGRADEEIITRLIANPAGLFSLYLHADPRLRCDRCDPGSGGGGSTTGPIPMAGSSERPPLPADTADGPRHDGTRYLSSGHSDLAAVAEGSRPVVQEYEHI